MARKPHRLVRIAALVGVATILAPAATAGSTSSSKYGPLDPWAVNLLARQQLASKYGPLDPWAVNLLARQQLAPDDRSDHGVAGIGAGVTAALLVTLLGTAAAFRQTRSRHPAL